MAPLFNFKTLSLKGNNDRVQQLNIHLLPSVHQYSSAVCQCQDGSPTQQPSPRNQIYTRSAAAFHQAAHNTQTVQSSVKGLAAGPATDVTASV